MGIRNISWPEDQAAVLEHIRLVHGPGDHELVEVWYGSMPTFDPADCFVLEVDNRIIAHAMLLSRQIQIGECMLPVGEIAMVGVQPEYRGRGVAHALLDIAHDRMTGREDALGLIFGIPNFYEHWQYEYAVGLYLTSFESSIATDLALKAGHWSPEHSYERRTADRLNAHNRPVIVRRFFVDDLPAVQALYAAESARGHYMIARDDETWLWQLDYMTRIGRYEPDDFLVAEIDGQLVAYARLVAQSTVNWFREHDAARFSVIEAAGDNPDAIEALLAEIARTAQAFAIDQIGLFVHPKSAFMRHALARGACRRDFTGAGFMRLHNLPLTLERLLPTLESRRMNSRYVSRAYRLRVATENDQAEIMLGMGSSPETVDLEVPSTSLIRLLTGWYGIDRLGAGYPERYTDLLNILFPRRDPKIGLADMM